MPSVLAFLLSLYLLMTFPVSETSDRYDESRKLYEQYKAAKATCFHFAHSMCHDFLSAAGVTGCL